jgi:hypothetical protein
MTYISVIYIYRLNNNYKLMVIQRTLAYVFAYFWSFWQIFIKLCMNVISMEIATYSSDFIYC